MVNDRVFAYFKRVFHYLQYEIANDSFDATIVLRHFIYNTYLMFGREVTHIQIFLQRADG